MNNGFNERIVLERIKPKSEEYKLVESVYRELKEKLEKYLAENNVKALVTLQGSIAKDTWLSGETDVDVFVLFPEGTTKEWIKTKGIALLESALRGYNPVKSYAEHPYLKIIIRGVEADVVPGIHHKDPLKAETVVDRTPFHTRYINEHLTGTLKDEVRLLKQFLRAMEIYGAEVRVKGFSGYLAELLILYFNGFRRLLKAAAGWRAPVVIDVENHYGGSIRDVLKRFRNAPLVVVDPVDPRRNVAAAVSLTSLATFSVAARLYLEKPSIYFFYPPEARLDECGDLKLRLSHMCGIKYEHEDIVDDTLWGELWRLSDRISRKLVEQGFSVRYYSACRLSRHSSIILVETDQKELDRYRVLDGPPWHIQENVLKFINKHCEDPAGPYIGRDGKLYTLTTRMKHSLLDVLRNIVESYGSTSHLHQDNAVLLCGEELLLMSEEKCFIDFVCRKPPWLRAYLAAIGFKK